MEEEGVCPTVFYKTRITLIPEPKIGEEEYIFLFGYSSKFFEKMSLFSIKDDQMVIDVSFILIFTDNPTSLRSHDFTHDFAHSLSLVSSIPG